MHFLPLILIALLLSMVPFSVALSSSVYRCIVWKEALRIAFVFALFQAVMVAMGWFIGFWIKNLLYDMAVPVAALIVFFIGARMFLDSRRLGRDQRTIAVEDNKLMAGFAFVISINTALLGMGLGIMYKDILILAGLLFAIVFIMTIIGIQAGKHGMMNLGKSAELLGGLGLIMISIVIVMQFLKIF
jgi:manganese efflux pump family protein